MNPFIGTGGTGNTFPGASLPFGMMQWSPDTTPNGFYKYQDTLIRGFSLTHLNGAGCPIFGDIPFLPTAGPIKTSPVASPSHYAAPFSHEDETAAPGYYAVKLKTGVEVKLSVTARTGLGVITYPQSEEANVLINAGGSAAGNSMASVQVVGDDRVIGWATSGAFCGSNTAYTIYFTAAFDRPFKSFGTWNAAALNPGLRTSIGKQPGAFLTFDTTRDRAVKVKVGISYVSIENALLNLNVENGGWDFEAVRRKASAAWDGWLSRVEVGGATREQEEIFYTALYHALLSPNVFNDVNGEFVGFDRAVHTARGYTHYTNISDWDTYRTQVQLLALLAPRETSDVVRSLLADARQSGWLPKWPLANDVTGVMGGDNPVPLIATAYAFGARAFDAREALGYMLKAATEPGAGIHGYTERPRLPEYLRGGYVPFDPHGFDGAGVNSASVTLEYANDDFCIARFARSLGDAATHRTFMRRAQNWQHLFDAERGFIRPKRADGVFLGGFDPDAVLPKSEVPWDRLNQAGFQEGNTWQYTWMVPFNYRGLFRAIGGDAEVVRRLDKFFTELTGWGRPYFNIANEPSFVSPYAYAFAGAPWRTQATVRRIMAETFNTSPAGLPGNDDLGATSAWYIWGAVGLYPAIPGVGGFVVGSPAFPSVKVRLGDGRRIQIVADGGSPDDTYIRGLTLNGRSYRRAWLPIEAIGSGETNLKFTLAAGPDTSWPGTRTGAPPSFTEGQAPAIPFIYGDDSLPVRRGGVTTFALGVQAVEDGPIILTWEATVPAGFRLHPSSGTIRVEGGLRPKVALELTTAPDVPRGSYTIPIRFRTPPPGRSAITLPETVLEVRVGADGAGG